MKKINLGGCGCKDCNNNEYPSRSWLKRLWKKEIKKDE